MNKRVLLAVFLLIGCTGRAMQTAGRVEFDGSFFASHLAEMIWRADLYHLNRFLVGVDEKLDSKALTVKMKEGGRQPWFTHRVTIFELAHELTLLTHESTGRHVDQSELKVRKAIFDQLMLKFEKNDAKRSFDVYRAYKERSATPESPKSPTSPRSPMFAGAPALVFWDDHKRTSVY